MPKEENLQIIEETDNLMATPYHGMTEEIRVMLVDLDKEFVDGMVDLLKSSKYKVTTVDKDTAKAMLSNGKEKIDAMIINVRRPYFFPFRLLAQAVALDIISFFTCDEHNELLVMTAFNIGAHLLLKKPLDEVIVENLWQFVLRGRIKKENAREGIEENANQMNVDDIGNNSIVGDDEEQAGKKNNVSNTKEQSNDIHEAENDFVSNEKYKLRKKRGRESKEQINEGESHNRAINKTVTRKSFIKWTDDLHAKFMEAMQHLGEGRCFPKRILEMMNVPGLTRTHIASHLQKCRKGKWKPPKNDHNLNVNAVNVTTYAGSTMMSDTNVGNAMGNGLGAANANFQQYFDDQNMFDSYEKENYDLYYDFDFDCMNYSFQNLELSSSDLPNEQNSEFDQVYSHDQVTATRSIQLQGIANFPNEPQHDPMLCEIIDEKSPKGSLQ